MSSISAVVDEALRHPSPGFALGKRLAELFPQRAMIEGGGYLFDTQAFAAAGHCTIAPRLDVYNQYDTHWSRDHGVTRRPRCEWSSVTWEQTTFDVVWLTYPGAMLRDETRFFVLAHRGDQATAFVDAVCRWNHEVRGEILVFNGSCFTKDKALFEAIGAASFDDVVLEGALKDQLRADFARFLGARATYEAHGVPWKRGALFVGPPGNGKTLCVKALVRELAIPCIYVQTFESKRATVQHGIEAVFERARATTPCILVLEDVDALLVPGSHSYFLNELDGFASNAGVITLATTNHPERLDASIADRPSRFDRKYHFELPGEPARAAYIAGWNARLQPALRLSADGVAALARATAEFSFAYIQEVFVSSMMRWMATRDDGGIARVADEQVGLLRAQMTSHAAR